MSQTSQRISKARTVGAFMNGRACSDTLFHMIAHGFGHPMVPEERAVMPMAGGIVQHGYQCGMLWGATLGAGAAAFRRHGPGPRADVAALRAAERLLEAFRAQNAHLNCLEITDIDRTSSRLKMVTYFLLKGGTIRCFRRAARFAPAAYDAVDAALEEPVGEVPETPASCAALLARKLGVSDERATMAAGLAGGIGLSGGACGALGAAIWLSGLGQLAAGATKVEWKGPKTEAVIERFLKASDYEFECAGIVGRRFGGVADHARFLRGGGCAKLLDALASP